MLQQAMRFHAAQLAEIGSQKGMRFVFTDAERFDTGNRGSEDLVSLAGINLWDKTEDFRHVSLLTAHEFA